MSVPSIDKTLGMRVYATTSSGIGGIIREAIDDFIVEEVLVDGAVAKVEGKTESRALGASDQRQAFLLCVLVKRNWDTLGAVLRLAKELGISQSRVQIAGIKDARAITAQYVTIEGVSAEEVSRITIPKVDLQPVGYFRDRLAPFYLRGNKFKIAIKNIADEEANAANRITETICELRGVGGIPNFFGHQRFGTKRPITHLVGKSIVKGDFEEAAMLFLAQTSEYEHPDSRRVRNELLSTRDFKQASRDFPKSLRYERAMLSHLSSEPNDYIGAFERLPPKLQELFVQAYQSYLFNLFLSQRISRGFSLNRAEPGDFVISLDRYDLPIARTGKIVSAESLADTNALIDAGKIRIAFPLVGSRQRLSEGSMGEIQKEVLMNENVNPEEFRVGARRIMSGKGELRQIVSPIKEMVFSSFISAEEVFARREARLSFMLSRGSYATMLLREIMKPSDPVACGF